MYEVKGHCNISIVNCEKSNGDLGGGLSCAGAWSSNATSQTREQFVWMSLFVFVQRFKWRGHYYLGKNAHGSEAKKIKIDDFLVEKNCSYVGLVAFEGANVRFNLGRVRKYETKCCYCV